MFADLVLVSRGSPGYKSYKYGVLRMLEIKLKSDFRIQERDTAGMIGDIVDSGMRAGLAVHQMELSVDQYRMPRPIFYAVEIHLAETVNQ